MTATRLLVWFVTASVSLASAALADVQAVNPVVDFGPSYAMEGTRMADDHTSTAGDELVIVGQAVLFQAPLDGLDANAPDTVYTYIMDGLISAGTVETDLGLFSIYDTAYTGGTFRIYCDTDLTVDFSDLSTFTDGTLILEGDFTSFATRTRSNSCAGTQNGIYQFTGGTLLPLLSVGGVGCTGIDTGTFSVCASTVPDDLESLGYFAFSDTKLDVDAPPVPVEPTTWGRIKDAFQRD